MPKLVGSVQQASNDAFAEGSIATGLTSLANQAWRVELILFETSNALPNTNGATLEMALSRGSKSAMPNITDRDVLFKYRQTVGFTTSGSTYQPMIFPFTPASELLIVEETLYFQLDSASIAAQVTGYFSVEVSAKRISEQQRLSILASRIGS